MSNSVRPHRQQPTSLCCPWDSPGKNTGVACHFLLQCMKSEREVTQSCPTPSDPMDCSPPGSSFHGIFIHLPKPVESTKPRVGPKVNCGLWVMIMCQCGFILGKKHLVSDTDPGKMMHVWRKRKSSFYTGNLCTFISLVNIKLLLKIKS